MSATLTSNEWTASVSRVFVYADLQMTDSGVYGWRFIVESMDGGNSIEATDVEPGTDGERLELLSVLRALESLEQPSQVLLLTPSQYVIRGIRYGLDAWRESAWRWERFGRMVPVKNADLWGTDRPSLIVPPGAMPSCRGSNSSGSTDRFGFCNGSRRVSE